jgi:hypothetical protein
VPTHNSKPSYIVSSSGKDASGSVTDEVAPNLVADKSSDDKKSVKDEVISVERPIFFNTIEP